MERSHIKYLIITTVLMLVLWIGLPGMPLASQQTHLQNMIYKAYVGSDMSIWEKALVDLEQAYEKSPSDDLLYDVLLAQYGLIGYYLAIDDNRRGRAKLDKAREYLEVLHQAKDYEAEAMLFQAAFNAFRISLRPWLGVNLGPQSERLINDAIGMKTSYPRAWVEKGNLLYFAPAIFGGSKTKAIDHYSEAIRLMEANMQNNHRWLYLSTLVGLARAYEKTGDYEMAIATLEKSLTFEPNFLWVKDEVLPEIQSNKISNSGK